MDWLKSIKEGNEAIPEKIYIELTSRCNLSCKMCFRHSWIGNEIGDMTEETFFKILNYLKENKAQTVFFGGMGEPLFYKNICDKVKKVSPYCENTELITNATLLDRKMSEELISSGLTCLWISMDGFSEEEYEKIRLGGRFKKIADNIREFNFARENTQVKLGITFVVMEENESQLSLIDSFADEYNVDIINISHAIPGTENAMAREFYKRDIPVGKMHRISDGYEQKPKEVCPFVSDRMCFVKYNGDVVPCMQILHSCYTYMFDVKREIFSFGFGNVNEKDFKEIYQSKEYKEFRNNVLNFNFPCCTVCDGCELRETNETDCMFNEKPTCGACLWATGKVFCP